MKKLKGKLLKDKKKKGKLLKTEQKGDLIKPKVLEGDPLWKKKKKLNENGEEVGELNEG
jgi:hypothetical protein